MIEGRVIVDGSNIATEGRTTPSLAQLDEAVRAFQEEFPQAEITVVVDATFGHRIDDAEKEAFEEAVLAGELVTPPAGAIGRGDAFVLTIANRASATVFSNDSFQEFHGDYSWLFDEGRLIGGKPVPGVGWVFVLRAPVRGPISRRAQRVAKGRKPGTRTAAKVAATAAKVAATVPAVKLTAAEGEQLQIGATKKATTTRTTRPRRRKAAAVPAEVGGGGPSTAVVEPEPTPVSEEGGGRARRRRRGGTKLPEPVNDPVPFLEFVSAHPVGSVVEGTVERFSSHGAYVAVEGAQCYVPLRSMADPPPKSAREVLKVGESRSFVVESFDSPRRSIDLALPELATAEPPLPLPADEAAEAAGPGDVGQPTPAEEAPSMATTKKATAKKSPGKKAASAAKSTAKKATSSARSTAKKATTTAKRTTTKKTSPARKSTAAKKTTAKKSPAKKSPAKKSTAKRSTAAKKTTASKKSPAKKSTAAKKTSAAKKSPAKKTTARKTTARKTATPSTPGA